MLQHAHVYGPRLPEEGSLVALLQHRSMRDQWLGSWCSDAVLGVFARLSSCQGLRAIQQTCLHCPEGY